MNKIFRRVLALALLIVFPALSSFAQQEVEMADTMRAEGKIYVVVAILLTILGGLLVYLVLMDRKVSRLEKKVAEKHP